MKSKKDYVIQIICLIFLGICVQIFASEILTLVLSQLPNVEESYGELLNTLVQIDAKMLIYVLVIAPILEESIFRLFLMWAGLKILPFWCVNIIQALLFGIYHGNWVQGIYAFILGMFLGYIRYESKFSLSSIIVHISINSMGILMSIIPVLQTDDINSPVQIITVIIATILMIVITGYLHIIWKKQNQ